jgi:hypothetical protein
MADLTTEALLSGLRRHGIRIPRICLAEARKVGLEPAVGAAVLMRESSGGQNVFGHDRTIFIGAGKVTKAKYLAYRKARDVPHHGSRCQGVGPVQLTYVGYQDQADALGGSWNPSYNVHVGFAALARNIRNSGLWKGLHDYNGSGPAAVAYANDVSHSVALWRTMLAGAAVPAEDVDPVQPQASFPDLAPPENFEELARAPERRTPTDEEFQAMQGEGIFKP